jgi:arsenate reductase
MIRLYYNASCSKCQTAIGLIDEYAREEVELVEYMNNTPTAGELRGIVQLLGISAIDLVRKKEPLFIEKFADRTYSEDEWLTIMSENPVLIERPILIKDNQAIIGRPPEKILDMIQHDHKSI